MEPLGNEESLNARVHEAVRMAVVSGELEPGRLYSVNDLANQLGVSRTPVREAIIRLSEAGMVQFERGRGIRVLEITAKDLEEIFVLRLLLEVPAARRAVSLIGPDHIAMLRTHLAAMRSAALKGDERSTMESDRSFHRALLTPAGNIRLVECIDGLRDMVLKRGKSTAGRSRTLLDIVAEHDRVLGRVESGDANGTASALAAHIQHTGHLLLLQEGVEEADGSLLSIDWAAGHLGTFATNEHD